MRLGLAGVQFYFARIRRIIGKAIRPIPNSSSPSAIGLSTMKLIPSVKLTARAKLFSSMPPRIKPMSSPNIWGPADIPQPESDQFLRASSFYFARIRRNRKAIRPIPNSSSPSASYQPEVIFQHAAKDNGGAPSPHSRARSGSTAPSHYSARYRPPSR